MGAPLSPLTTPPATISMVAGAVWSLAQGNRALPLAQVVDPNLQIAGVAKL